METERPKALQFLDFVFEGADIRYVLIDGKALFIALDLRAALFPGSNITKRLRALDDDEKMLVEQVGNGQITAPVLVSNGYQKVLRKLGSSKQLLAVTESGLYHLIFLSRKPAAKRFRRLVTEQVLPALVQYGCYPAPETSAEAVAAVRERYRALRLARIATDEAELAQSNLMTVAAFRHLHAIPAYDALDFSREVQRQIRGSLKKSRKFFTHNGPVTAWPIGGLMSALVNFQPRLPLLLESVQSA